MALDACISIKGKAQFEGTSKKAGHLKSSSIVHAVYHEVATPMDLAHGAVTHRRQHGLMTVEMLIDASVYQIYQACIDKDKDGTEKLVVIIQYFRPNQENIGLWGGGENKPYLQHTLTDAFVASVEFVMGDTRASGGAEGAAAAGRQEYIKVKFAYRQIEWMYMNGNKAAQDKWDT